MQIMTETQKHLYCFAESYLTVQTHLNKNKSDKYS